MTDEDLKALQDNLTATQNRCTELLNENRDLRNKLATLKLRWLQLLEMPCWEDGPDEGKQVLHYSVSFDDKARAYVIERDVSPPSHRCVEDGHSYGHGDSCFYCGHVDEEPVPLNVIKVSDAEVEEVKQ